MKNRKSLSAVGGSSLLVIFAVLCLTVFAMLALSTVQADGRIGKASAEAVKAYYEADCRAEEILAQLRMGTVPSEVIKSGDTYRYVCEISKVQELLVEVKVTGSEYQVCRWQIVSTTDWKNNEELDLWDGEIE